MNVLDLFSGIGGFSLGLERAGMHTVAFCESDPYCRRVLAKHWPELPIYDDVRRLTAGRLAADGIAPDLICGGFPCQPHSVAGARLAAQDERDLWPEFGRLIREVRPRWVVAENVPGLLSSDVGRFFGGILRDLAACGYDAEWQSISAADVGAPHLRERIWIVAYPNIARLEGRRRPCVFERAGQRLAGAAGAYVADAVSVRKPQPQGGVGNFGGRSGDESQTMADAGEQNGDRRLAWAGRGTAGARDDPAERGRGYRPADVQWLAEPGLGRVADGIPARVDRLRALGNALVPQIAELIGHAILESDAG